MQQPATAPTSRKHARFLRVSSILLIAGAVVGTVSTFAAVEAMRSILESPDLSALLAEAGSGGATSGAQAESSSFDAATLTMLMYLSAAVNAVEAILQIAAGVVGLRTARGKNRPETCQTLGIVLVGAACVAALVLGAAGGFSWGTLFDFAVAIFLPCLFYAAARRFARTTFWDGIKEDDECEAHATQAAYARLRTIADELPATFCLDGHLAACNEAQGLPVAVRVLSFDEVRDDAQIAALSRQAGGIRHCHADVIAGNAVGTLAFPAETLSEWLPENHAEPISAVFALNAEELVFATDDPLFKALFARYVGAQLIDKRTPSAVLFEFLEFVIRNDMVFLNDQQDRLDKLEENMAEDVNEIPRDFEEFVMDERGMLRSLVRFYKQYVDTGSTLATERGFAMDEGDRALFQMLAERARRLADDAQDLFDYALQIKSLYQSKIDVRQNKVMQILTIVTSVFMPLTLITGWYGMNFEVMPELHWRMSYLVVILVAISVVTAEIVVFKRKKWF